MVVTAVILVSWNSVPAEISTLTDNSGYHICQVTNSSVPIPVPKSVDLGLSVEWASFNLGSSKPEEYGLYYQWGKTKGYSSDTSDGKWFSYYDLGGNVCYELNKYSTNPNFCPVDNKIILEPEDDAATVALGHKWRMPTNEEWEELRNSDNCSWTWTTINGVKGYKVQSKKPGYTDNWIFLPAAGFRFSDNLNNFGTEGYYWSSYVDPEWLDVPYQVWFDSSNIYCSEWSRCAGLTIRPVSE